MTILALPIAQSLGHLPHPSQAKLRSNQEVAELAYNFCYAVQLQILFVHISDIRSHIILEQGQRLS